MCIRDRLGHVRVFLLRHNGRTGGESVVQLNELELSLIHIFPEVEISEIEGYKAHGVISGGMIPKIEGMADAIYEGVHEAVIIDGRVPHSVLLEMFSDRGSGTP